MKIKYKLPATFLIFTLSITALFYLAGLSNQRTTFRRIAIEHLREVKDIFNYHEQDNTKMLFSVLAAISRDPGIKTAYLTKNRDRLFSYVHPVFEDLKNNGITEFYFIQPDGRVFLRVHDKGRFGDPVKRTSFSKAVSTKKPSWDIELGKTAFALRAVTPFFKDGKLIGYIELSEGINHFLASMKDRTGSQFFLAGQKRYLSMPDWQFLKLSRGLRNNWNDLKDFVVLGSTNGEGLSPGCFTQENMEQVEKGMSILQQVSFNSHTYMCGGFVVDNAENQPVGAILAFTNITGHVALAKQANMRLIGMAAIFFLITFSAGIIISRLITGRLGKMAGAARAYGRGDIDRRVEVKSTDELGELAAAFNIMAEELKEEKEHLMSHEDTLEKIVAARTEELAASEERYRRIVETAQEGIIAVDENEKIVFVNESLAGMLDFKKEELPGRKITEFMDERSLAEFRARQERRKKGVFVFAGKLYDLKFRGHGGKEVWAIVSSSSMYDATGKYTGFVSLVTDITERRRLEAIAEAANLMENVGYIFSGIRHEIANPVVTASITLDVMKRKLKNLSQPQIEEYIERTREQMSRLDFLLKSLRNFNMFEAVALKSVDIRGMLEKFLPLVTDDAKKRGIKIESEVSPDAKKAYLDERAFNQVLLNIVTNAFDALQDRVDPKIKVGVLKVNRLIMFRVEDNGKGMTPQQAKNLFRPFFTTKPHGTGLGLTIVKKMVSKMQGHIEITSNQDEGTIVDIFIPESGPEDEEEGAGSGGEAPTP